MSPPEKNSAGSKGTERNKFKCCGFPRAVTLSPRAAAVGRFTFWDPATGKETGRLNGHSGAVYALAFTADGKTLASGGEDKTIRLWDVPAGKQAGVLGR